MKSAPRVAWLLLACLLFGSSFSWAQVNAPADWSAWPYQQQVTLKTTGLVRLRLPEASLDHLDPSFANLRVLSTEDAELPWAILRPRVPVSTRQRVNDFAVRLEAGKTVASCTLPGKGVEVSGLELYTPAPRFNKAVQVEVSDDGVSWRILAEGLPLFRAGQGTPTCSLRIPPVSAARLRLTLDDTRSEPIPVVGLSLLLEGQDLSPARAGAVTVRKREELAGQTRISLSFPAKNAHLAALRLQVADEAFSRRVHLVERALVRDQIEEHSLASATLAHIPLLQASVAPSSPPFSSSPVELVFRIEHILPTRDLVLVIENEDNMPLPIRGIEAAYRDHGLVLKLASTAPVRLFSGAQRIKMPHYDLEALLPALQGGFALPLAEPELAALSPNPYYLNSDPSPDLPLWAAELDSGLWASSRPLLLEKAGVQQLELDVQQLAASAPSYQDLRVVAGLRQIPYLLEHCPFQKALELQLLAVEPKKSGLSRWRIKLPAPGIPLEALLLRTEDRIFQRELRLFEELKDKRGESFQRVLGSASWVRSGAQDSPSFQLRVDSRPQGQVLILETRDGDNLPLTLAPALQARLPVIRLHFKTEQLEGLNLLSGNDKVSAPSYDLRLAAQQLLAADCSTAHFRSSEVQAADSPQGFGANFGKYSAWLFWGVLILVVSTLLFIVVRLLPKPKQ